MLTDQQKENRRLAKEKYCLAHPERLRISQATYRKSEKGRTYRASWQHSSTGKACMSKNAKIFRSRNPEKKKANALVNNALNWRKRRCGPTIQKSPFCEECGRIANCDGHHDDYSKPYDVRWLCRQCHRILHDS